MRPGRIVMLVLGTLSALFGLGLLAGAGAAGWANYQQRDNGYFTTPSARFAADSYALTSPRLGVMTQDRFSDTASVNVPGSIVIRGSAADPAKQIFIGIAPQAAVATYLADVQHSEVTDVRFSPFRAQYLAVPGSRTPPQPADQGFWTAAAAGPGAQELRWDLRSGNWAVVVMNADASMPVAVDLQAGARSDLLWPIFVGLLIAGLLLLAVGVPLIVAGAAGLGPGLPRPPGSPPAGPRQAGQPYGAPGYGQAYGTQTYGVQGSGVQPPAGPPYAGPPYAGPPYAGSPYLGQPVAGPPGTRQPGAGPLSMPQPYPAQPYAAAAPPGVGGVVYPARVSGYLDPDLSRWLWLVKWLLAIPHFIILLFLWFALIVVTIAAWFAILFTGRYPRSLFNFSVGVIRWNWRVSFYAYGALGTDRYPPFTLARTDYPADFDVDYPERLSRGLVLVKSWLLAIPHLLIVAVLTGTAQTWTVRDGAWVQESVGISLLGLLVFIAGVILLFTGQYRRGLFDLVLGLNRWIYRVITYVALMRDEYRAIPSGPGAIGSGRRPEGSSGSLRDRRSL
ncbi:hypothetical protein QFZ69_004470 [Arthrobacter sp. V1I7]|uniref:DUF4389 domain-containing protein n=1 Tax=Arthrobacter sp. V1I7 TaxID=3042274 RepID=UPI002788516C|nr:DUF4389 domain-containing protein [Arthrobacter sp. V1I7]MDQ0823591.1 hypothetical protein [Arthrobacter sp. V1I7]